VNFIDFEGKKIAPSKIVCVGRNYVEHIKELNNEIPENMVLFNKPNSAISQEFKYFDGVRFEGELSFLIQDGQICGVGFGFDLTNVKIQEYLKSKGLPWERAKAFDGSAVFSEFVSISKEQIDKLSFRLYQKSERLAQEADFELMIYKPQEILDEVKSFMSLEDGDIIMSGTPEGVDFYQKNEEFLVKLLLDGNLLIEHSWRVI
jgi:2-keto-4-pentenoate hydratase/2-oxohepta-3-ene-1,7-dioic acid hydratase in catechol pathway